MELPPDVSPPSDQEEWYLPDLPLHLVMTHSTPQELLTLTQVDKRYSSLANADLLWKSIVSSQTHPVTASYISNLSGYPTWRARYTVYQKVQRMMMEKRHPSGSRLPVCPIDESRPTRSGTPPLIGSHFPMGHALKLSLTGPIFCVNTVRTTSQGTPSFLAGGSDGQVSYIEFAPTGKVGQEKEKGEEECPYDPDAGPQRFRQFSEPHRNHSFVSHHQLRRVAEWRAHDGGMLGMSVDSNGGDNVTAITCSFSGESALWRVNAHELEHLASLPAKRLKAILKAHPKPVAQYMEGMREKEEFISLINRLGAFQPATPIAHFHRQTNTVVSSSFSFAQGLALNTCHDGSISLYDLTEAKEWEAARMEGRTSHDPGQRHPPTIAPIKILDAHRHGCDIGAFESHGGKLSTILSGGKDGTVKVWDTERGVAKMEAFLGEVWVWCVRSANTLEGGGQREGGGGVFSHPSLFLTGDTGGVVRLMDQREGRCVAAVGYPNSPHFPSALSPSYVHIREEGAGGGLGECAIAGLALNPAMDCFVTTGFAGELGVWDARKMTIASLWSTTTPMRRGDNRIARACLLGPDLVAGGEFVCVCVCGLLCTYLSVSHPYSHLFFPLLLYALAHTHFRGNAWFGSSLGFQSFEGVEGEKIRENSGFTLC